MNPWPFILGAYGLTLFGTLALVISSFRAMRRAEKDSADLGK